MPVGLADGLPSGEVGTESRGGGEFFHPKQVFPGEAVRSGVREGFGQVT